MYNLNLVNDMSKVAKVLSHKSAETVEAGLQYASNTAIIFIDRMMNPGKIMSIAYKVAGATIIASLIIDGVENLFNLDLTRAKDLLEFIQEKAFQVIGLGIAWNVYKSFSESSDENAQKAIKRLETGIEERKSIVGYGIALATAVADEVTTIAEEWTDED
ncbi:MAG: hypothetical protein ACRCX2_00770 [Paraclostridium sp.]